MWVVALAPYPAGMAVGMVGGVMVVGAMAVAEMAVEMVAGGTAVAETEAEMAAEAMAEAAAKVVAVMAEVGTVEVRAAGATVGVSAAAREAEEQVVERGV